MANESLLGHVTEKFSVNKTENIASESLAYILQNKIAKRSFFEFIEQVGFKFDSNVSIHTQAHDNDEGIPDLVGKDRAGRSVLIIEAKFWAGLTGHQPVSYLKKLPLNNKSVLLFLAPSLRLPSLWSKIIELCSESKYRIKGVKNSDMEFLKAAVNKNHYIALTSWSKLLAYIQRALETKGLFDASSDVKQLIGLCEKQDTEAFLPLKPEELGPQIGRRVYQYTEIVEKVVSQLGAEKVLVRAGLLPMGSAVGYGWYRLIDNYICFLEYNAYYWSKYWDTPIWLSIRDRKGKNKRHNNTKLRESLKSLERENPSRLLVDGEWTIIPLTLPTDVVEKEVISSLVRQVRDIRNLLSK